MMLARVADSLYWIGRYIEAWAQRGGAHKLVYRKDVKMFHCESVRATDAILVKLEPGRKKDDRNLKIGGGGGYWTFSMRQGVRSIGLDLVTKSYLIIDRLHSGTVTDALEARNIEQKGDDEMMQTCAGNCTHGAKLFGKRI